MRAETNTATQFHSFGRRICLSFDDCQDHIARVIRESGDFYEAEMLADIRGRLFYARCAVDVGAHIGNHSIFFAAILGLRTIAFEPTATSFSQLEINVAANAVGDLCALRKVAVGAAPGKARPVSRGGTNSGMTKMEPDESGTIDVVRLDDALTSEPAIDLIKIDVEGWELDVLRGAHDTLSRFRPLIYVEIGSDTFEETASYLNGLNYVCWRRFNATPTFLFMPRERFGFDIRP